MQWLPQGQLLPEHIWRRRHQGIVVLLWLHIPALLAFGLLIGGNSIAHVLGDISLIALPCGPTGALFELQKSSKSA